jgi:hypothetical protein
VWAACGGPHGDGTRPLRLLNRRRERFESNGGTPTSVISRWRTLESWNQPVLLNTETSSRSMEKRAGNAGSANQRFELHCRAENMSPQTVRTYSSAASQLTEFLAGQGHSVPE